MQTPVEKYGLNYQYLGDIRNGTPENAPSIEEEIKNFIAAETELYENLTKVMSHLSKIPEMFCIRIALEYNSDAPPNYAAPGFTNDTQAPSVIKNGVAMKLLHNFQTQWNRLDIYSKYSGYYHMGVKKLLKSNEVAANCFCLKKLGRDFTVIRCSECQRFSHSVCYGILVNDKKEMICVDCAINNNELECTDTALMKLTNDKKLLVSLIRLSLYFLIGSKTITADEICKSLKIEDVSMLEKLLRCLKALKVMKPMDDG